MAIVPTDDFAVIPAAFDYARRIAQTEFVPGSFRNRPEAILAAIMAGRELGLPPMQSLSQIAIIDGRPALSAFAMRALITSRGHELWVEDSTSTRCILGARRRGTERDMRVMWTWDDALRAELSGKRNWQHYPRQMLLARATGDIGRLGFADILGGMPYVTEEIEDGFGGINGNGPELPPDPHPRPSTGPTRRRRQPRNVTPEETAEVRDALDTANAVASVAAATGAPPSEIAARVIAAEAAEAATVVPDVGGQEPPPGRPQSPPPDSGEPAIPQHSPYRRPPDSPPPPGSTDPPGPSRPIAPEPPGFPNPPIDHPEPGQAETPLPEPPSGSGPPPQAAPTSGPQPPGPSTGGAGPAPGAPPAPGPELAARVANIRGLTIGQEVAMVCREAGIERRQLIGALTGKTSGNQLTREEALTVLTTAREIAAGTKRLMEENGNWYVAEVVDEPELWPG
jgi:hypothetical protein